MSINADTKKGPFACASPFFCVGAQKAGTTTLHDILRQHPDIFLPNEKETRFFQADYLFRKGFAYYQNEYFSKWKGEHSVGEIDPEYMYFKYVARRIYDTIGNNVRFIFMLRNPVDRAYSHYQMTKSRGLEKESFITTIKLEPERISLNEFSKKHFSYISRGFYTQQIKAFLDYFPKKNMLFVLFEEEFINNRLVTINDILSFLGVKHVPINVNKKSNPATTYRSIFINWLIYDNFRVNKLIGKLIPSRRIKRSIRELIENSNQRLYRYEKLDLQLKTTLMNTFFQNELSQLEKLIDKDLTGWRFPHY